MWCENDRSETRFPRFGERLAMFPERPGARRWQRHLRFSLRGLIRLVLLIGACLGWVASSASRQRVAVRAIEKSGGAVLYDWQFKNGRALRGLTPASPKWLADNVGIDYFNDVTWAAVGFRGITDDELLRVGYLKQLEELQILHGSGAADAGLANLESLSKLRKLFLGGPEFTDAGLAKLERLTTLWALSLSNCSVTDAGLVHLKGLTSLKELGLTDCKVSDAALVHVRELPNLKQLRLPNCQITNAGLANLDRLPNLIYLILDGTKVTDAGLVHVKKLIGLQVS